MRWWCPPAHSPAPAQPRSLELKRAVSGLLPHPGILLPRSFSAPRTSRVSSAWSRVLSRGMDMDTRTWPPGPSNVFLCLKHQLSRWFPGSERGVNGRERARMRQYGTTESSAPGTRETREAREGAHAKTRLVIRRLPPGLTSSEFHAALASESCPCQLSSVDFVAGSESKAYMGNRYVGGGWHTRVA